MCDRDIPFQCSNKILLEFLNSSQLFKGEIPKIGKGSHTLFRETYCICKCFARFSLKKINAEYWFQKLKYLKRGLSLYCLWFITRNHPTKLRMDLSWLGNLLTMEPIWSKPMHMLNAHDDPEKHTCDIHMWVERVFFWGSDGHLTRVADGALTSTHLHHQHAETRPRSWTLF